MRYFRHSSTKPLPAVVEAFALLHNIVHILQPNIYSFRKLTKRMRWMRLMASITRSSG